MANTSDSIKNETVVHEFGHALGLAHTQSSNDNISVMRQYGFNNKAYPLLDDKTGFRLFIDLKGDENDEGQAYY